MKVALIARSTLHTVKGGDTFQVQQTAARLADYGIEARIILTHEKIDYSQYDLLHFFNVGRPADILHHVKKSTIPFVLSPILVEYSNYDKHYRKGLSGWLFRFLSNDTIEYFKTIARWLLGKDKLVSKSYLWKGHRNSIRAILQKAAMLLPNSDMEYQRLAELYHISCNYIKVPNGIDPSLFNFNDAVQKDPTLVLCVARIEGIKNQLNLVKALNNTAYKLVIIGAPAPNQLAYYEQCKKIAAGNISFIGYIPQEQLVVYYQQAKVHILPSWFETCGLSTLEAGVMGCNVVITDKGYTREYFGEDAVYCDPASPESILAAVNKAALGKSNDQFRNKILSQYTWSKAAAATAAAYKKIIQ